MKANKKTVKRTKGNQKDDGESCHHCKSRNTATLDGDTQECYDCGRTYKAKGGP